MSLSVSDMGVWFIIAAFVVVCSVVVSANTCAQNAEESAEERKNDRRRELKAHQYRVEPSTGEVIGIDRDPGNMGDGEYIERRRLTKSEREVLSKELHEAMRRAY